MNIPSGRLKVVMSNSALNSPRRFMELWWSFLCSDNSGIGVRA